MKKILLLAFICAAINGTGQTDRFYEKIDSLVQIQQFQTATGLLEQYIRQHPGRYFDHAQAYLLMSKNDLQLGNIEAALTNNQHSMELRERLRTDDIAENYLQLGAIYLAQEAYDEALSALQKAKELPFENPQLFGQVNNALVKVYTEKKEFRNALENLEQSLKLMQIDLGFYHPDACALYFQMGQLHRALGQLEEADLYFKKAIVIKLKNYMLP